MIPMNGYEKASKARDEDTLFPSLDPSNDVKLDVWREYHLNRFWASYLDSGEDSCPSCRSSSYTEEEKQLDVGGFDYDTVLVCYRCTRCGQRWKNERPTTHKYEP